MEEWRNLPEFLRGLANLRPRASPQFVQVGLFLSSCSNLSWLVKAACGIC